MSDIIPQQESRFLDLTDSACELMTENSARIYSGTYQRWLSWCAEQEIAPLALSPKNVKQFVYSRDLTHATRLRYMSAFRKLAQTLWLRDGNPNAKRLYDLLKETKLERREGGDERNHQALSVETVRALLDSPIYKEGRLAHMRNRTAIAFLFGTGCRRSEAVVLQWRDVDFENGTAYLRQTKGDKPREVAVADFALDRLQAWHYTLLAHAGTKTERQYAFPPTDKHNNIGADRPISADTLYLAYKRACAAVGVDSAPHDARRTFITEYLRSGGGVADAQAQAGHAREETTLRYAKPVSAGKRRDQLRKMGFGD